MPCTQSGGAQRCQESRLLQPPCSPHPGRRGPSPLAGLGWWPPCFWRHLVTPVLLSSRGRGACRRDSLTRSEQPAKAACATCPCRRRRRRRRISFARPISSCPRLCMDAESPQEGAVKAFNVQILQGGAEF